MHGVMKTNTLIIAGMLVAGASFAGEPLTSAPSISTAAAPSLADWFVGGSVVSLDDADDEVYTLHFGRDLSAQFAGFSTAWYAEVGYQEEGGDSVVPLTLNLKLERPLVGALNAYLTAGAGYALVDAAGADDSLYGQASAGLLYNLNERFELFGGARYTYFEESSSDDWGWELGGRINF